MARPSQPSDASDNGEPRPPPADLIARPPLPCTGQGRDKVSIEAARAETVALCSLDRERRALAPPSSARVQLPLHGFAAPPTTRPATSFSRPAANNLGSLCAAEIDGTTRPLLLHGHGCWAGPGRGA
ncbi:hypothetical protein CDD83_5977 [Cordyceps sp. RAO-2017]|nr:hypothetical protein CDD83_5977 [Cordyceps sp. RAO-2017]